MGYLHGRNKKERIDSVNVEMLENRRDHLARCAEMDVPVALLNRLESLGLGTKRRRHNVFSTVTNKAIINNIDMEDKITATAAGGHGVMLTSAAAVSSEDWPLFAHLLPEVAFAGHSNSGKSTLVNAMVGVPPRHGPASVSDRAGWTDQICFYKLGKRPPKVTLADLPGYGFAVASPKDIKFWKIMTRSYLSGRLCLSFACVLVDCTRGLCASDTDLLRFLHSKKVAWHIVLTKADLLSAVELAQSILVVQEGLNKIFGAAPREGHAASYPNISPVSASTGAGIAGFWTMLCSWTERDAVASSSSSTAVKEHRNANAMRRAQARPPPVAAGRAAR